VLPQPPLLRLPTPAVGHSMLGTTACEPGAAPAPPTRLTTQHRYTRSHTEQAPSVKASKVFPLILVRASPPCRSRTLRGHSGQSGARAPAPGSRWPAGGGTATRCSRARSRAARSPSPAAAAGRLPGRPARARRPARRPHNAQALMSSAPLCFTNYRADQASQACACSAGGELQRPRACDQTCGAWAREATAC
jgi:hypothetical protein